MIERDDPKAEVGSFEPPPAKERKRVTFPIPPSAPTKKCRSCGLPIVWIVTTSGSKMPVDADGATRGDSHFATCPQAHLWRQR